MSFKNLNIKPEYRSLLNDIAKEFLIPTLNEAVCYDRAVGFFSSSVLSNISKGIEGLARNNGKIRLVASPYLSQEDVEAIKRGYSERKDIITKVLVKELKEPENYEQKEQLNLLANLIRDGILDIKIAFTENTDNLGIYHEKLGVIKDLNGNIIAFSGSMNESEAGLKLNYEAIDVFCSWKNQYENDRVIIKQNAFEAIWSNCEPNIVVLDFPDIESEIISRYLYKTVDYTMFSDKLVEKPRITGAVVPDEFKFYDYQQQAIDTWVNYGYRGIFDMATGTGKTYTGLGAIARLNLNLNGKLAVIIVCPYQHLVNQWVEDINKFNIDPIIGYSTSSQKDWKNRLSKAIIDQKIRKDKSFFCFVCTNATFSSKFVQGQIDRISEAVLLVVDEAHNIGAKSFLKLLDDRFTYRLALSATLERHLDQTGTQALFNFFGEKCIEYSLERAIKEDKLTPYRYYPVLVYLTEDELEQYEYLSQEISKCTIILKNGECKLNKKGEFLALQRARIVAGAENKLLVLKNVIEPYKDKNNILVYCGSANVDYYDNSYYIEDIRQIEAVTKILGLELGMSVAQFTSNESISERAMIKEKFSENDGLQAIVAIKCLDEGVNIPGIKTAFILASTTNPKEYIQRRGRVLRKAKGKRFAEIYDFVTLPRPLDEVSSLTYEQLKRIKSLARNEVLRMNEFGRLAENSMESLDLIWQIEDAYRLNDNDFKEGVIDD